MNYLVDTDVVAEYLKGIIKTVESLNALTPQALAISLITYGEIYDGIYHGRNPTQHEQIFLRFLQGVTVLPLNRSVMKRFSHIRGQLRQTGQIIGDFDILIAATALHHDLTLITHNRKHFSRIPTLKLSV
jgi:tRNA(fMet)-specific endonuclease VapC